MTAGPPPPVSGLSTPKVPQPQPQVQRQASQPVSTASPAQVSRLLPQATQSLPSTPSATASTAGVSTPSRFAHLQSLSNPPRANTMSTNAVGRVMSVQPPPPSRSMTQAPAGGLLRSVTSATVTRGPRVGMHRPTNAPTAMGSTATQGPRARAPSFPRPLPPTGPVPTPSSTVALPPPPTAPRPPPPRPIQVPPQPRADVELLNQEETSLTSAAPWTGASSVVPTPVPNSADATWSEMVREMAVGLMVKDTPQAGSVVSGAGVGAEGLGAPVPGRRRPLPPTPQSR
ncbi:hypothetical protein FA13DRAFT_1328320 [Coprinellus micaceus]|uniref:Uncharacterized protein n=1 Tax=Coprinellus micaceus TaxID=71717 RepID=A0A4Y7SRB8_COPMI|nr:hypothetical protein FA13DRAFT_1328320 [Coprinellus micaceus]